MVLPLIGAGLATLVFGYFFVGFAAVLAHWISIGAGIVIALRTLQYGLSEDPIGLFSDEYLDALFYALVSALIGFVAFKIIEAALAVSGFLIVAVVVVLAVASYVFGLGTVVGGLASIFSLVGEFAGGE